MAPKRKQTNASVEPTKAVALECEFCGKAFKARGLKLHQNKCPKKTETRSERREFCFEQGDTNAFAVMLSFLSNQSIVKLQSVTGARYPGSNSLVSSICCKCENDELAIANGLCLACNKANEPEFRETITTTEARRLYGIDDIDDVPHKTRRVYQRGYYCLFKHDDLSRYAQVVFGSKQAWLEMLAVKVSRRRKIKAAKQKKKDEYRAFLSTFSDGFADFIQENCQKRENDSLLKEQSERYDLMVTALTERGLTLQDDSRCTQYILYGGVGEAKSLADSIIQKRKEEAERLIRKEQFAAFTKTLPKPFVQYVGSYTLEGHQSESLAKEQAERYNMMVAALAERGLELRSDSALCRQFISSGTGKTDEIVDTMEEMKFLFAHTSYANDCRAIIPQRRWREWSDSDESSDYDDWIPASTLQDRREQIKVRIRDRYLRDSRGLTLPRKWLKHQCSMKAS